MNKSDALKLITKAAGIYERYLSNKNLLIVFNNVSQPYFIATKAMRSNFLHLIGVIINQESLLSDVEDKQSNCNEVFYLKCLYCRLSLNDFEFKDDGTTIQKLKVILAALNLYKNAKMIGDFNNNRVFLKTDKIVGNDNSYLGFIFDDGYYVPNTVIKGNIKIDSLSTSRVLAILSKPLDGRKYKEIKYTAKNIDVPRLLKTLEGKIPISPDLLTPTQPA